MNETIKRNLSVTRRGVERLHKSLDMLSASLRHLESQDCLEFSEIQELMGAFNQAETLASNIIKKRDDIANAVIGKT
jgi:hypothetical protein